MKIKEILKSCMLIFMIVFCLWMLNNPKVVTVKIIEEHHYDCKKGVYHQVERKEIDGINSTTD